MRRFFIDGTIAETMEITGDDAHHLRHVLRARTGQTVVVVDSRQQIAETEILGFEESCVRLRCMARLEADTEPPVDVTLFQLLPKGDKMDFIVQKAVEIGASRIVPVIGSNCVVKYDAAKRAARQKKWQRIAEEAAKQCGRTLLPVVDEITDLNRVMENPDGTALLLCYEGTAEQPIQDFLQGCASKRIGVIMGPEGGFSPAEVELCRRHGVQTVTMGPRILRAETAALAALCMVLYEKGDLGGRSK